MFNFKAILLLLVALAIGGGAAVYANQWIQRQQGTALLSGEPTDDVIVAAREIPYGLPIEESHLRVVAWPSSARPADIFTDPQELIGKIVNQTVVAGEPLLQSRVVEKLTGSRLSALIAPNKRAITVRVNDVAGVAGFLLPGNFVDILATRVNNRRAITETLLQNIKVLAIDQKASPDKDDPVVVRAVTLEADLKEASKLAGATQEGTIQLVLRNPGDSATTSFEEPVAKTETRSRAARDNSRNITIIRGTSVNQAKVKL